VYVKGQLASTFLAASKLDPRADACRLSLPRVLGAVCFTSVLAPQQDEPSDERADRAD
jgi:hypothetical protein